MIYGEQMTSKDVFAYFTKGKHFTLVSECIITGLGMIRGEKYNQDCVVERACRKVRRIWHNPPNYKVVTVKVLSKPPGYFDISSVELDKSTITKTENGFTVEGHRDKNSQMPVFLETYLME